MRIQFRWWDGQADPHDPKTGAPATDNLSVAAALNGKVLSGIGGISSDSEAFNITSRTGVQFGSLQRAAPRGSS
jgi:hypothetical protein